MCVYGVYGCVGVYVCEEWVVVCAGDSSTVKAPGSAGGGSGVGWCWSLPTWGPTRGVCQSALEHRRSAQRTPASHLHTPRPTYKTTRYFIIHNIYNTYNHYGKQHKPTVRFLVSPLWQDTSLVHRTKLKFKMHVTSLSLPALLYTCLYGDQFHPCPLVN